jgi:hypothetical protein
VKAAAWLDPEASSMGKGGEVEEHSVVSLHQKEGEIGVRSTTPGGGMREGGELGGVGAKRGGGGGGGVPGVRQDK